MQRSQARVYFLDALHNPQNLPLKKMSSTFERVSFDGKEFVTPSPENKIDTGYKDKKIDAVKAVTAGIKDKLSKIYALHVGERKNDSCEIALVIDFNFGFSSQDIFVMEYIYKEIAGELDKLRKLPNFKFEIGITGSGGVIDKSMPEFKEVEKMFILAKFKDLVRDDIQKKYGLDVEILERYKEVKPYDFMMLKSPQVKQRTFGKQFFGTKADKKSDKEPGNTPGSSIQ